MKQEWVKYIVNNYILLRKEIMWNIENCKPANKIIFWNVKWDELHKFNKNYYYTMDIKYNETEKVCSSTISFFEKTGKKIFDMEVQIKTSTFSSPVKEAKENIIEYLGYLTKSDESWSSFFLAKKMIIKTGFAMKYKKYRLSMQDITFFIPEKQNKNKFTQISKQWEYLVSIFSDESKRGSYLSKLHIPYFERNWKIEFFFHNQEIKEVETLEKEMIWEKTFYSNKNKLLEKYYTITNDILNISNIIYYKPLQILFSFFEKELDKKWVKNYEIFLWNYENSFNSNNYSSLYYVLIQLQIFVNGVFDEKLTEGFMEIYSQTWWNISRRFLWNVNGENVYWKYINFLVDKFSPIFTFDKEFYENILRSFVDLWHGYFYLDSFSRNDSQLWRNNIYKYSYEENKFIPLEKSSQTQQILEKSSIKNWFCYINSNFDLKVFIDWDKEYSINLVKALKIKDTSNLNSESFKHLLLEDNWKEVFLSYRWKIIYLSFKEWVWFNKIYQFDKEYDINQDITFGSEQTYFYENWNSFMVNVLGLSIFIPINNLLNFDPSKVLLKKIIINDIYVEDSGSPSGIYDWYRFMYGLKWYFFIKKYNFEFKKEKKEEEKESNLFSRWVYNNIWGKIMLMRNNSYASVTTSQNSSIEKLCKNITGKKMFGLSNWKIWFYE